MEMPTKKNGSVGGKFTERSMINELGQCKFSPLDSRVDNPISQDSCF